MINEHSMTHEAYQDPTRARILQVLLVGHLFLDRDYYYIYSNVARVAHNFSRRLPAVYPPFTRRWSILPGNWVFAITVKLDSLNVDR